MVKIKNLSVKHLAVSSQMITLIMSLFPFIKSAIDDVDEQYKNDIFNNISNKLVSHKTELFEKIMSVSIGIIESSLENFIARLSCDDTKSLKTLTANLVKNLRNLKKIVSSHLDDFEQEIICDKIKSIFHNFANIFQGRLKSFDKNLSIESGDTLRSLFVGGNK